MRGEPKVAGKSKSSARAPSLKAISLFSSAGLGELGLKRHGFEILVANELLNDRAGLYVENHGDTKMFPGDIWELRDEIVAEARRRLGGDELFVAYATPPCQGMSTNGVGKLMAEETCGNRVEEDARNRLIIPAMDVICALNPRWILLENVPGMQLTEIRTDHGQARILDYIQERLGSEYLGKGEVLSCSDYGIPQLRKRLITVFTRDPRGKRVFLEDGRTFFPSTERTKPLTLRDVIERFPPLEAVQGKERSSGLPSIASGGHHDAREALVGKSHAGGRDGLQQSVRQCCLRVSGQSPPRRRGRGRSSPLQQDDSYLL